MSTHSQSKPAWASSCAVKPVEITDHAPKDGFLTVMNVDLGAASSLVAMPYLLTSFPVEFALFALLAS